MVRLQRLIRRCLGSGADDSSSAVLVRHEPTKLYLGVGLVLTERDDAVAFESVEAARRFLQTFGNEPCLVPVPVSAPPACAPASTATAA